MKRKSSDEGGVLVLGESGRNKKKAFWKEIEEYIEDNGRQLTERVQFNGTMGEEDEQKRKSDRRNDDRCERVNGVGGKRDTRETGKVAD